MRLLSFRVDGRVSYGALVEGGIADLGKRIGSKYPALIDVIRANALGEAKAAAASPDYKPNDVEFLTPVQGAEKTICIGINYPEREGEYKGEREKPKYPNLFARFPDSFVGHDGALVRPKVSEKFDYEGELVLVIGKPGRHIPRERAFEHIFGLTLGNEGSVRDWIRHGTVNVTQGKNFDHSGSLGPWVVTADEADPRKPMRVTTKVNGELRQDDTTDRITFDFPYLINYISTFTTLKPGDLIFTGTPVGAGGHQTPPKWLVPGDVLEITVPEVGTLRNHVVDET